MRIRHDTGGIGHSENERFHFVCLPSVSTNCRRQTVSLLVISDLPYFWTSSQ